MAILKAAVIGTGNISRHHMNGYRDNPNVELYALCDIDKQRALEKAETYGVPAERVFTDKDEMLRALPEIDIVSVTTWNSAHAECAIAALNAGKHVLVEKPMALNAKQAAEMMEAAERNGKLLMIGFVRRYENYCKLLLENVESGFFGDIYYAKTTYLRRHGNPGGWFGDKSRSGGGPLIDLGVHVIDYVRYLKGRPKAVSVYGATYQKLFDRPNIKDSKGYIAERDVEKKRICDVEDLASAIIRFEDGSSMTVEASFSLNGKPKGEIELFGTKAGAKIDGNIHLYSELNDHLVDIEYDGAKELDFDTLFHKEIDHFADCVLNGTECIAPAEDGVELMRILDGIYESARTGHEVIL
ncbi:MAG: Gfo/Idh/MocA family protein [Acutalibacteraceae bacterium]